MTLQLLQVIIFSVAIGSLFGTLVGLMAVSIFSWWKDSEDVNV